VRDTRTLSVVLALLCPAARSRTNITGFAVGNVAGNFHRHITLHQPSPWQHELNYREEEDGHRGGNTRWVESRRGWFRLG